MSPRIIASHLGVTLPTAVGRHRRAEFLMRNFLPASLCVWLQIEEFASMEGCLLMSASVRKMYRYALLLLTLSAKPKFFPLMCVQLTSDNINFQPQHLSTVITGPAPEPTTSTSSSPSSHQPLTNSTQEYVVKLRGVPWDATDTDIIRFVEPVCQVTAADVHIVTNFEVGGGGN